MNRTAFPAYKSSPYIGLIQYAALLNVKNKKDASTQTPKTDYQKIGELVVDNCPEPSIVFDYIKTKPQLSQVSIECKDEQ